MPQRTLLVGLAHPDDEVGVAGTILAQRSQGDRVVIVWLTRGEMTEAFGPLPADEVAARRMEQGHQAGEMLGVETRFLDFPDTGLVATPESARRVAQIIAEIRPDGVLTWGDAWARGMRHPDHQACGRIFRDAITLARIAKVVAPADPHRAPAPVWTFRDAHSTLPAAAVDVEEYIEQIEELGRFYLERVGFGDPMWIRQRLADAARPWGLRYAEVLDAWETEAGRVRALLPAHPAGLRAHPDRPSAQA